jgi:hypothetical protein
MNDGRRDPRGVGPGDASGVGQAVRVGHPAPVSEWTPEAQLAALDRIERIETALTKIFGKVVVKHIDWNPEEVTVEPIRPEDLDADE